MMTRMVQKKLSGPSYKSNKILGCEPNDLPIKGNNDITGIDLPKIGMIIYCQQPLNKTDLPTKSKRTPAYQIQTVYHFLKP